MKADTRRLTMQGYNPDYSGLLNAGAQQAQALGNLGAMGGQLLGQRRQQEQAQQYQQQQQQEVSDALASGNPAMVAQVSMKYPELSDSIRKSFEFQNDATEDNFKSTNFSIISDPGNTERYLTERVSFLESMGADATKPKARLEMYRSNPEKFIETTRGLTAAAYPKEFSDYEKAIASGKPEAMTAYQQATIDTKKVDQDLRRLEIEQKRLDAQYKRETDELKRSELEQKIEANKVERESKVAEKEQSKVQAVDFSNEVYDLATSIANDPQLNDITGPVNTMLPTVSGKSQDLINKAERLESMLTKENLGLMSGVLTDKDIQMLRSISSGINVTDGGIKGSYEGTKKRLMQIADKIKSATGNRSNLSDDELLSKYL
ncbi:putative DNA injection protein [Vibrio phage 199E37-1]|nr:putative DNA injection protein [Vibrio phage 199E37-1]